MAAERGVGVIIRGQRHASLLGRCGRTQIDRRLHLLDDIVYRLLLRLGEVRQSSELVQLDERNLVLAVARGEPKLVQAGLGLRGGSGERLLQIREINHAGLMGRRFRGGFATPCEGEDASHQDDEEVMSRFDKFKAVYCAGTAGVLVIACLMPSIMSFTTFFCASVREASALSLAKFSRASGYMR